MTLAVTMTITVTMTTMTGKSRPMTIMATTDYCFVVKKMPLVCCCHCDYSHDKDNNTKRAISERLHSIYKAVVVQITTTSWSKLHGVVVGIVIFVIVVVIVVVVTLVMSTNRISGQKCHKLITSSRVGTIPTYVPILSGGEGVQPTTSITTMTITITLMTITMTRMTMIITVTITITTMTIIKTITIITTMTITIMA